MMIRCPLCQTTVWVKADLECPSCRKTIPSSAIPAGATFAAPETIPAASPREARSTGAAKSASSPASERAARGIEHRLPTVRRTSWGMVFGGILFVLTSALFFWLSTWEDDKDDVRRMGRGARLDRALEATFGESGSEILYGLFFLGLGVGLIATCRRKVLQADQPAAASAPTVARSANTTASVAPSAPGKCDFCARQEFDVSGAFLTIQGGLFKSLQVAFRCQSCEACLQGSYSIGRRTLLTLLLMILGIPFAIMSFAIVFGFATGRAGNEALTGKTLGIAGSIFGVTAGIVALLFWLHRSIRRQTVKLLGPRLEPVVRSAAGVNRWGWPRRPVISRSLWAEAMPVIDLEVRS